MCRRASRRPQWGSQLENPSGKGGEGRGGRGLAPRSRGSQAAALPRSHPRREPRCQRAQPTAGLITGRQSAGPEPSQIPRGAVAGDEVGGAVTGADATAERPWLGDRKSGRWGSLSAVIYGAARTQTGRRCPGNGPGWLRAVSSARGEQCSPKAAPAERGLSAWLCSPSPGSLCLRPGGHLTALRAAWQGAWRLSTRTRGVPGGSRDVPVCQEQDSAPSHLVPPALSPARGCRCL